MDVPGLDPGSLIIRSFVTRRESGYLHCPGLFTPKPNARPALRPWLLTSQGMCGSLKK